jgi:protein-L-isoaspartate(D-aspartate) O-methyltransferase
MITTKEEMIELHLKGRNITDPNVINAMSEVDRSDFMPDNLKQFAYEDSAFPISKGQTISQPYIVAYMAQELKLKSEDIVLEIGSGSGYNAAVLSKIVSHIYSIEIIEWLAHAAKENLKKTNIENVTIRHGDGYKGWPEKAPFDVIILTAAPPVIPELLKKQLKIGGKLLAPVGKYQQHLVLLEKNGEDNFREKRLLPVQFVPMTGGSQKNIENK